MRQIFFKAFIAAVGGLIAWMIWEPQFPASAADKGAWAQNERWLMLTLGVLVGFALGATNGWAQGSKTHLIRMGLLGALCGAVAAVLGHSIAGAVYATTPDQFVVRMLTRAVALSLLGACIGAGVGLAGATGRRIVVGVLGGLIGGAIAGILFDPLALLLGDFIVQIKGGTERVVDGVTQRTTETGIVPRALYSILMPLFIGLFMGVLDRVVRTAWLRLNLGRNEGKEWVVDAQRTYIGRSEGAHVPLFGDSNIGPLHACIAKVGDNYILMDSGTPLGTFLNGQKVTQAPLFDGAQIQVGQNVLIFQLRAGSAPQRASEQYRSQAAYNPAHGQQPAPMPQPVGQPGSIFGNQPTSQPTMMQPGPQNATQVAPGQPMTPTLVAISGPLLGNRFPIGQMIEAGREAAGIGLSFDTMASRKHATFSFTPNGVVVTDLGSTNGTFVNDQRIQQQATIRPGDTVRIGVTTFRLE
ncbi:MAG: FHA domain-containing protein [Fimbriimonadaceae bacterium]|nr:FHA domain-containing protein [Fimbriimonadaceae bacterium]